MVRSLFRQRLVIAASGMLLVTLALFLPITSQTANASTSSLSRNASQISAGVQSAQIAVSSTVQWVDTGVTLSAGDTLKVSATGSWSADPTDGFTTPDGYTQAVADNFLNLTDLGACTSCASTPTPHWGALIGYIGNNPPATGSYTSTSVLPDAQKVFVVGSNFQSSAKPAGELWLNFNDDAYSGYTSDNAGQVTATINVTSQPQTTDLVVTKTVAAPTPRYQGDEADYQITVKNRGPITATNVHITDNLPTGVTLENPPQTSQGTCAHTSTSITCTLGTLAVGQSAQVFLTTSTYSSGKITNKAKGASTQTDPNPANNTGSATITLKSAQTSSSLTNQLRKFGIKLKAAGIILGEAECVVFQDKVECALVGTELLADKPGLTGERAASYLRYELATLCIKGLAKDDLFECAPLWIHAFSELAAPPPAS